jgi:hypothetical protein
VFCLKVTRVGDLGYNYLVCENIEDFFEGKGIKKPKFTCFHYYRGK